MDYQVPRYDVPHVMALKVLSNHCENLNNGPSGLALDGTVWTQQLRRRNAKQIGISRIPKPSSYEEILLLLIPVNCCTALIRRGNAGELEAAGLLSGDSEPLSWIRQDIRPSRGFDENSVRLHPTTFSQTLKHVWRHTDAVKSIQIDMQFDDGGQVRIGGAHEKGDAHQLDDAPATALLSTLTPAFDVLS